MNHPEIKDIKTKKYIINQSKYENAPRLPLRMIIAAPSGAGKTNLINNLIMDVYKPPCFSRIFIWSPTIWIDDTWLSVREMIEDKMKIKHSDKNKLFFDYYDPSDLKNVIDEQHKLILYMKKNKMDKLFQILVVIDDFGDNINISKHSQLNELYIRGRHDYISCICSVQRYNLLSTIIRTNATDLIVFRLRNMSDLNVIIDETSALANKQIIMKIYELSTSQPYSFLYIKLNSQDKKNMFFIKFGKRIIID